MIKNTKLPILAKYSIVHALKCQQKSLGNKTPNSKNYLQLTISLMFEHSSMPTKINKAK